MVRRKNKYTEVIVCLIGICILGLSFSGNVSAKSKKTRLNVGFGSEEVLKSLQTGPYAVNEMGAVYWPLVYDQLWLLGPPPEYNPLPGLAKSWETKDYKTWRFHLVENATFHDGTPLTAEDVAFTLWYLPRDPQWAFPSNDIAAKKDIKVIDKYTVEFTMARAFPGKYPPADWMPILPAHIWKAGKRRIANFEDPKADELSRIHAGPVQGEATLNDEGQRDDGEKQQRMHHESAIVVVLEHRRVRKREQAGQLSQREWDHESTS